MANEDHTYDHESSEPRDLVRLLLNDVADPWVFTDAELDRLLKLEGDNVKRAAAQAIDSQATNEALASKVLSNRETTTDGAKLADSMRKHAASLRDQADREDADSDDAFYFGVVDLLG